MKKGFFIDCVKEKFKFLEDGYKMEYRAESQGKVIYSNNKLYFEITYDYNYTGELDMGFDLMNLEREPFSLATLLELYNDGELEYYRHGIIAENEEILESLLEKFSKKLKEYIDKIFTNDNIFTELFKIS